MNRFKTPLFSLIVAGGLVFTASAFAATPTTTAQPAATASAGASTAEAKPSSFADHVSFTYFGDFSGPSVAAPTVWNHPSGQKKPGGGDGEYVPASRAELYNSVSLGYKLSDDVKVSINPRFNFYAAPSYDTDRFVMLNSRVRIADKKLVSFGGDSNMYGDAYVELPTNEGHAKKSEIFGLGSYQETSFPIGKTPVTLGTQSILRLYFYSKNDPNFAASQNDVYVYFGPYAQYQLLPNLAAYVRYEMEGDHTWKQTFGEWNNEGTSLKPGMSWDISKNVNIFPYFRIRTGESIAWKSTALGMEINGTLF